MKTIIRSITALLAAMLALQFNNGVFLILENTAYAQETSEVYHLSRTVRVFIFQSDKYKIFSKVWQSLLISLCRLLLE